MAALIKGIPVVLKVKTPVGADNFNIPIYETIDETVENVLVAPASADDVATAENLYGKKAVYSLGIPKGDTHNWLDTEVEFFGETWRTFGFPLEGIESNIPLDWNKKVMVERYG
ncbi:MAG: hypothetical protein J6V70_00330 [Kiritimatiellae bacterium]|nr:hypothetical protein [Kiritimatiellia bacterium]